MRQTGIRQTALVMLVLSGPALAAEPRVWEVPGALEAIDVPGRTVAGELPVSMHAVRSKHDAAFLQAHFLREFKEAGLWLGPQTQLTVHRQVTGLDVDTRIVYSVFLQTNRDKSTTAILTETFAGERAPQAELGFAPLMPGAKNVLLSTTEGAELVTFRVRASVKEVRAFYGETLGEACAAALELRARQAGEWAAVSLKKRGGDPPAPCSSRLPRNFAGPQSD